MKTSSQLAKWTFHSLQRGAWAPLTVFGLHVISTFGFKLYHRFPFLDIPTHFLGGIAIAYFFGQSLEIALKRGLAGQPSPLLNKVLLLALTGMATICWEFAEWSWDFIFQASAQGGLDDTMLDILMGLWGGLSWIGVLLIFGKSPGTISDPEN